MSISLNQFYLEGLNKFVEYVKENDSKLSSENRRELYMKIILACRVIEERAESSASEIKSMPNLDLLRSLGDEAADVAVDTISTDFDEKSDKVEETAQFLARIKEIRTIFSVRIFEIPSSKL